MMRRVAVFAPSLAVPPGWESNISGHIQIPLTAARLLMEAGHDVELISTRARNDYVLPTMAPGDVPVRFVADTRRRGEIGDRPVRYRANPLAMTRQARDILRTVRARKFDCMHGFGYEGSALWLGALGRLVRGKTPVVFSLLGPLSSSGWRTLGYSGIDRFTAPTAHVASSVGTRLGQVSVVRHGVVRDLVAEEHSTRNLTRRRVLFWREATQSNGGDLCRDAFRLLARAYPDLIFSFALRVSRDEVPGLEDLERSFDNVEIFRFPYQRGPDLSQLMAESLCIVLPFRRQSIHPQLSVLESMRAGVPVVALNVGDMGEVITDGTNGVLVQERSPVALASGIERIIAKPKLATSMGMAAGDAVDADWMWAGFTDALNDVYSQIPQRSDSKARSRGTS
ncbi:MAG: glycosyltransferase [Actinobacteria bacterium]|nr:glycosyltransferase [Actinomycetota bacterium]